MKIQTAPLLLALTVMPLGAVFACDAPVAPPSPDGGSATLEEMIAAQGEVKAFQAANAEYLECVDNQMSAEQASIDEGDESAKERYALAAADYNAAVSREAEAARRERSVRRGTRRVAGGGEGGGDRGAHVDAAERAVDGA